MMDSLPLFQKPNAFRIIFFQASDRRIRTLDVLYTILCAVVVLGVLVFIHEGGHFLAARAFGVRVTEFMLGLPGPSVGFVRNGTRFGVTAIPLGGYAKVCGMETGPMSPHLECALSSVHERGTALAEDVARDCGITVDQAIEALDELVEWGSVVAPKRADEYNVYRTPRLVPSKKDLKAARRLCMPEPKALPEGSRRKVADPHALFESELSQQYRSLPFWKRSVILLAGIAVNLLFAIVAFVLIYSVIGIDYVDPSTGEAAHIAVDPWRSLQLGFGYIGMTFQGIMGLFNPETAAETVSNSTSIVGIAVMSTEFFAAGVADALFFMAVISISLGLMNLLPIPPLDGGRFVVEVIQKVTRRDVPMKVMGFVSMAGMALFLCFFVFMLNQDIQRFVLGNW